MENVRNKTAIVTGAGSGIGYCITEELLHNGAKQVAIIDLATARTQRSMDTLQQKFGKERVLFFGGNVTKPEYEETFKKAVKALGGLDILVNNAGIVDDLNVEGTFAVNSIALIRGSLYSLNYMSKHKGGKGGTIINIASSTGLQYTSCLPVYSASKYAVIGFSQALKDHYKTTNVRVLTICPFLTKTPIGETAQFLDFVNMQWHNIIENKDSQSPVDVARAVIKIIQKGENGALWSIQAGEIRANEIQPARTVSV